MEEEGEEGMRVSLCLGRVICKKGKREGNEGWTEGNAGRMNKPNESGRGRREKADSGAQVGRGEK